MNDVVKDEQNRVNAPDVSSEFEREIRNDVYSWAGERLGKKSIKMSFENLARLFWSERLY